MWMSSVTNTEIRDAANSKNKQVSPEIQQLFSKPLPSLRSGVFYNTFPYPTKISPEAIAVHIACCTNPDDTVLDAFAGSGSTGIAALLCEHPTEQMIKTANELGVNPVWGKRNSVLYEIGTYASFATRTLTNRLKGKEYRYIANDFITKAEQLTSCLYTAKDPYGNSGIIRYALWSEVLICPECGEEIDYFTYGTSRNPASFKDNIECPRCSCKCPVDKMDFATESYYDKILEKQNLRKKRKLVWIYGETNGKNWDRAAIADDASLIEYIEGEFSPDETPRKIVWGDLYRSGYHYGITHLHHFYTSRNYIVMSKLWKLADTYPEQESNALKLLLLSYNATHCTLMTRVVAKQQMKDFVLTSAQSGVLYISRLPVEKNILLGLRRKAKQFEKAYKLLEDCSGNIEVRNQSSTDMIEMDQSIDFIFTDPPFGDFIPYAEVNQINELWLPATTERAEEVIISNASGKTIDSYKELLAKVLKESGRVIKPDRHIAVVFHAAKAKVWNAFAESISEAGLEIELSSILDKTQATFKQVVSPGSVQGDPLFLLKKSGYLKETTISDSAILEQVLLHNSYNTSLEMRHCYSLYIGQCMEQGIQISMDAKQVYEFIKSKGEQ